MGLDFVSLNFSVIFFNALPTPLLKSKSYLSSPIESYFYFVGFEKVIYHFRVLCQPPAQSILYFFIQNTVVALPWWLISKEFACQCRRREFSSLVGEDPTCHWATKLMCHKYWACALEPRSHSCWVQVPQLLKPELPRTQAHAPQQEKPPQWEARTL